MECPEDRSGSPDQDAGDLSVGLMFTFQRPVIVVSYEPARRSGSVIALWRGLGKLSALLR
jgi:hypothetical protein